jgi:hypothetical protein
MTLEECSKLRDEIAARVVAIKKRWDQERTVDGPGIQELRSYCKRILPLFAGRHGNVGGKISQMFDAAGGRDGSLAMRGHFKVPSIVTQPSSKNFCCLRNRTSKQSRDHFSMVSRSV